MSSLDPRLHPDVPNLAEAPVGAVAAPLASVRKHASASAMQVTQALMGERLRLLERRDGWAWVQLLRDGYVGYVEEAALTDAPPAATHRVSVPSTFLYPQANIKSHPAVSVPMNAEIAAVADDGKFLRLADGRFVFARHAKPLGESETDFVAVAEQFLHVPYLWGGKSVAGLDCSGLVQLSLEACGLASRRDSDMQEAEFGQAIGLALDGLRRGDLVFWSGHVGVMTDAESLLHANGHHMQVVREPLRQAIERIAAAGCEVTSIRRRQ